MKKNILNIVACMLFIGILALLFPGCTKDSSIEEKGDLATKKAQESSPSKIVTVTFDEPITFAELKTITEFSDISVLHISAIFFDRVTGDAYFGSQSFPNDHIFSLENFLEESKATFNEISHGDQEYINDPRAEQLNIPTLNLDLQNGKVAEITISNNQDIYDALKLIIQQLRGTISYNIFSEIDSEATLRNVEDWAPNIGIVRVYPSNVGTDNRYVRHDFRWDDSSPFSDWYTYEHDFFLNNYSGTSLPGTYFSRETNIAGYPICYAASNLPSAYLDTRFLDNIGFEGDSNEIPYTIGSGNANDIEGGKVYMTYIRIQKGDADEDNAKLNGQLGSQIPIGCTSTWCSYGINNSILVEDWDISIPGYTFWLY